MSNVRLELTERQLYIVSEALGVLKDTAERKTARGQAPYEAIHLQPGEDPNTFTFLEITNTFERVQDAITLNVSKHPKGV